MALISGTYAGPLQGMTLEEGGTRQDVTLIPGHQVEVLDCEYTRRLVATGLLVPAGVLAAPVSEPTPAQASTPAPEATEPAEDSTTPQASEKEN